MPYELYSLELYLLELDCKTLSRLKGCPLLRLLSLDLIEKKKERIKPMRLKNNRHINKLSLSKTLKPHRYNRS